MEIAALGLRQALRQPVRERELGPIRSVGHPIVGHPIVAGPIPVLVSAVLVSGRRVAAAQEREQLGLGAVLSRPLLLWLLVLRLLLMVALLMLLLLIRCGRVQRR